MDCHTLTDDVLVAYLYPGFLTFEGQVLWLITNDDMCVYTVSFSNSRIGKNHTVRADTASRADAYGRLYNGIWPNGDIVVELSRRRDDRRRVNTGNHEFAWSVCRVASVGARYTGRDDDVHRFSRRHRYGAAQPFQIAWLRYGLAGARYSCADDHLVKI